MPIPSRLFALAFVILLARPNFAQDKSQAGVDLAIERGIEALLSMQQPDGSWRGPQPDHYHGMTALAVYTLLKCGLPVSHPAVMAGLASVKTHPIERTYDLGCALMLYEAMGDDRPVDEVKTLADKLVKSIGNGKRTSGPRWGYPGDHGGNGYTWTDLSNSQYALLGLRAARLCGYRAGNPGFWETIAKDLVDAQEAYGGFGYRAGERPSASMTVAGITMIQICAESLGESGDLSLRTRLRAGINRGVDWLDKHWAVDKMIDQREKSQVNNRWLYYYLYGLERFGAFAEMEAIGSHRWYDEGLVHILKTQGENGRWTAPYSDPGDDDTCFALLFLRRGSRSSGLPPRARAEQAAVSEAPFAIGMNGENPVQAWVRFAGPELKKQHSEGAKLLTLHWLVNGKPAASVADLSDIESLLAERSNFRHVAMKNGQLKISARVEMQLADGSEAPALTSNELVLRVDGIMEPWHREAVRDSKRNLLIGRALKAQATSAFNSGHEANKLVDGHFGTSWLSAPDDKEPGIDLQLEKSVNASLLKLTSCSPYGRDANRWARPRDVEIRINDDPPITVRLEDNVQRKQWVNFTARNVSRIRVRVKSLYRGLVDQTSGGFKEIELFSQDQAQPEDAIALNDSVEVLIAPARYDGAPWKYTTEDPGSEWMLDVFKDQKWAQGTSGFGTLKSSYAVVRTPWETTDLWVRREFRLPTLGSLGELNLDVCHDDHCDVYINGVLAAHFDGHSHLGYRTQRLSEDAKAALRPGKNLVAARCTNTGGVAYFDLALIRLLPRK